MCFRDENAVGNTSGPDHLYLTKDEAKNSSTLLSGAPPQKNNGGLTFSRWSSMPPGLANLSLINHVQHSQKDSSRGLVDKQNDQLVTNSDQVLGL